MKLFLGDPFTATPDQLKKQGPSRTLLLYVYVASVRLSLPRMARLRLFSPLLPLYYFSPRVKAPSQRGDRSVNENFSFSPCLFHDCVAIN